MFRLLLVVLVGLTTAAQLYQERRRMKTLESLPGPKARAHYEATRTRDDRLMIGVTAVLALAAAGATVAMVLMKPPSM